MRFSNLHTNSTDDVYYVLTIRTKIFLEYLRVQCNLIVTSASADTQINPYELNIVLPFVGVAIAFVFFVRDCLFVPRMPLRMH